MFSVCFCLHLTLLMELQLRFIPKQIRKKYFLTNDGYLLSVFETQELMRLQNQKAKSQVLPLTLVIMDYIKYLCYYLNSIYTSFRQMSFNRCFNELASKIKSFILKLSSLVYNHLLFVSVQQYFDEHLCKALYEMLFIN